MPMFTEKLLIKNRRNIFPFYHTVSDSHLPHIKHLYAHRNVDTFINDLDTFCRYFEPAALEDICKKRDMSKRPFFHLTFDDGLRECSEIIQPILLKKGIPATFFVNNDFIDNKALFFRYIVSLILDKAPAGLLKKIIKNEEPERFLLNLKYKDAELLVKIASAAGVDINDFLATQKPYMNTEEIKGLVKNGFTIGSHSFSHPDFSEMSTSVIVSEIKKSIEDLNLRFGIKCSAFSFPFSNHSIPLSVFNALKKDVPECLYYFGTSGVKDDTDSVFQRIPMEKSDRNASEIISRQLRNYRLKKIVGKSRIKR